MAEERYEIVDAPTPDDFRRSLDDDGRVSLVAVGDATIVVDVEKANVPPDSEIVTFVGKVVSIYNLPTSKKAFGRVDLIPGRGYLTILE